MKEQANSTNDMPRAEPKRAGRTFDLDEQMANDSIFPNPKTGELILLNQKTGSINKVPFWTEVRYFADGSAYVRHPVTNELRICMPYS